MELTQQGIQLSSNPVLAWFSSSWPSLTSIRCVSPQDIVCGQLNRTRAHMPPFICGLSNKVILEQISFSV